MADDALREALEEVLAPYGIEGVEEVTRLSGGASRETWVARADDASGERRLILQVSRASAAPGRFRGPDIEGEAALLRAAAEEGVPVPPVVTSGGAGPLDGPYLITDHVEGETIPPRIFKSEELADARRALPAQFGTALARLQRMPHDTTDLVVHEPIAVVREQLDLVGGAHPVLEWGLRRLAADRPEPGPLTLVHGDYRNGNVIVGSDGLRAVIDWELAHLGDPLEDLSWLCIKAWRFGAEPTVGGYGELDALFAAYERESGTVVDRSAFDWWLAYGTLRWAAICLVQAYKHLSGAQESVELAAIGRRACEPELDLLDLLVGPRDEEPGGAVEPDEVAPTLHDEPAIDELLGAVEGFLGDDLFGQLEGRPAFHTRVARRVLGTVRRELALGAPQQRRHRQRLERLGVASDEELVTAVRDGRLDGRDEEVGPLLRAVVRDKLAVANPRYLEAATR